MLFPNELDKFADAVLNHINLLERFVLSDVSRRISKQAAKYGEASLTQTAIYQLQALNEAGIMMGEIKVRIGSMQKLTLEEVDKMFTEANLLSFQREQRRGELAGRKLTMSAQKQQIIANAVKDFNRGFLDLTGSIGFAGQPIEQFFHTALNQAFVEVATGASNYSSAIRRQVQKMANSGLTSVQYRTRKDHMDVAVRRAVLTGLKDTTNTISEINAQELGCDGYEISAHAGARETHQIWQGRQFAIRTIHPNYPLFDVVVGNQMQEPNCRHTKWGIFLGQAPMMTEYQLSQLDKTFTFEGREYTTYQATQKQRSLEVDMRQAKREIIAFGAAGDTEKEQAAQARLKQKSALYTRFSNATNLLEQRERTRI